MAHVLTPGFRVQTEVSGTVDTSWCPLNITYPDTGDLFQKVPRIGTVNVRSSGASGGATQLTICLTEDAAGTLPVTNPGLSGSTQTLGTAPDGSTLVASWNFDALTPAVDKQLFPWVKADVGEFDNVYGVITWSS